jgi:hypothetical protein
MKPSMAPMYGAIASASQFFQCRQSSVAARLQQPHRFSLELFSVSSSLCHVVGS